MIEKLDEQEKLQPLKVADKLNEVIEYLDQHVHKSLDTQYYTSRPIIRED
jgi:hypothetical protein